MISVMLDVPAWLIELIIWMVVVEVAVKIFSVVVAAVKGFRE